MAALPEEPAVAALVAPDAADVTVEAADVTVEVAEAAECVTADVAA